MAESHASTNWPFRQPQVREGGNIAIDQSQRPFQPEAVPPRTPPFPAQPKNAASQRILHVYHNGLSQRTKRVLSTDKKTTLYTFEANRNSGSNFTSMPHIRIYNGASTERKIKGAINFYGNVICLEFPGLPKIFILSKGFMTKAHEYKSSAFPGQTLRWKKDGFFSRGDLVCEFETGEIVARLKRSNLSISKTGTFELGALAVEGGGQVMDELVAGGIALIELQKKQDRESVGDVEGGSAS